MVEVRDDPERSRVTILVDGEPAGFAQYVRRGERTYFVHTEVDKAHEGKGLGSRLARGALDVARERGEPIVPICPFIAAYVRRHPEYADLVDDELMERLGN